MRRLIVGLWCFPALVWAQPVPMLSEDVAPLSPSMPLSSGLSVTPSVTVDPAVPPVAKVINSDQIDQVLATVSATISSTAALVASSPTMITTPTEVISPAATAVVPASETTLIQQPVADSPKATVRVTGNAGAQDRVLQALKAMGLAATYTRITVDGAELAVPNANADTLAAQLHAKGLTAEMGSDGAVEVRF